MTKPVIRENYRDEETLRNEFFGFTRQIFPSVDFQPWFSLGFWPDEYIPHSVIEDNKIVSNVSITKMKIFLDGQPVNGIQIGTVGTLPDYRGQGLSKLLMEQVLERYDKSTDLFFLYANETVVDFYPRFGFSCHTERIFRRVSDIPGPRFCARALDVGKASDLELIRRLLKGRLTLSRLFGAEDYAAITWWHILNIFPRNLLYLEDENIIFIITENNHRLRIWDIIYTEPFDMAAVLPKVIRDADLKAIFYHFSPDQLNFKYDTAEPENDSPFFVRGRFPLAERAFKFPVTAQT